MMIDDTPHTIESLDPLFVSAGLWAPSAANYSVSDPLAGTRLTSTAVQPFFLAHLPLPPASVDLIRYQP